MHTYRTLAAATLALSALSALAAHAAPNGSGAEAAVKQQAPSTLTREAVIAELVAARQNGTLPRDGEWYNVPAPVALAGSTVTREAVRAQAIEAPKNGMVVSGN